jgi:hypothetical protein
MAKGEGRSMQPHLDKPYPKLEENIERLAEAEHETRDDAKKLHPDMRPHAKLPEREKGKDRNTIRVNGASPPQRLALGRHYPDFAARVGFRIVPIGQWVAPQRLLFQ